MLSRKRIIVVLAFIIAVTGNGKYLSYASNLGANLNNSSNTTTVDAQNPTVPTIEITGSNITNLAPIKNGELTTGWETGSAASFLSIEGEYFKESVNGSYSPYFDLPAKQGDGFTLIATGYSEAGVSNAGVYIRFLNENDQTLATHGVDLTGTRVKTLERFAANAPVNTAKVRFFATVTGGSIYYKDVMILEGNRTGENLEYVHGTQNLTDLMIEVSNENLFPGFSTSRVNNNGDGTLTFSHSLVTGFDFEGEKKSTVFNSNYWEKRQ